jgi:hypothetical protein
MPLITVVVEESAIRMMTAWSNAEQCGMLFIIRILPDCYVVQVNYEFCVTFVGRNAPRRAAVNSYIKFEMN